MQLAQSLKPMLPLENLAAVKHLVSESLFGDWVIQIEHSSLSDKVNEQWSRWGEGFFGSRDLAGLVDALLACRASNPSHAIRLNAQKLRPHSRLVYWVFQPEDNAGATVAVDAVPSIAVDGNFGRNKSRRLWRYGAVAGLLAAIALTFQEVAIARLF